jgi:RNA polymerase-binding transcription factor DksA
MSGRAAVRLLFAQIDAALKRLHRNPEQFGICEDTGEDVPFERLDAVPWAHLRGGALTPAADSEAALILSQ